MIEHQIKLDLKTPQPILLHMKQYDVGSHVIKAELYDDGTPYHIPQDTVVMLQYCKPDGTGGLYDTADIGGAITVSDSIVTIPVATQVLTAAGKVEAELDLYTGEELLSGFSFSICVHMAVRPDTALGSDDYYNLLAQQISAIIAAIDTANESLQWAKNLEDVLCLTPQQLSEAKKEQARSNISAADAADVEAMEDAVSALTAKADPPRRCTVSLSQGWQGTGPYTQAVSIAAGTANSKVDLQPEAAVLSQLVADGVTALYIGNDNGEFTAYAIGAAPTVALTLQATITEVTA